ncbi:MAG: LPS assembly protein LptD [Phycisphaeraceae bacterium]|nr:LPS assembly protein LptD [Phycisphaerales bacterium]MCB9860801.1 LPS assembly protein LptD [Phycisphaeraceae bacterium]
MTALSHAVRVPILTALASLCLASANSHAQNATPSLVIDPASITGTSFQGILLPASEIRGIIALSAQTAHVWNEPDPIGGGTVHRITLVRDVKIEIGSYLFDAERASLWLQPIETSSEVTRYQVFCYLDRVRTPRASADVAVTADRLPIEAVVLAPEPVKLRVGLRETGQPEDVRTLAFVRESERALASYLRSILSNELPEYVNDPLPPGLDRTGMPMSPEYRHTDEIPIKEIADALQPSYVDDPILPQDSIVSVQAGNVELRGGADERVAVISDGLYLQYTDLKKNSTVSLSAQRAVLFMTPGTLADLASLGSGSSNLAMKEVTGIYLEGDVIADTQDDDGRKSRFRAPKVYYDLQRDRSLLIDAVYWAVDDERGVPINLRADVIRREAANRFAAENVTLTNTGFREPMLSLAASSVTVTRTPNPETGRTRTVTDARNVKLKLGSIPFMYVPRYVGDPRDIPLRQLAFENSSGSGSAIKTAWDLPGLTGMQLPDGVNADLLVDGYFQRGFALGLDADWRTDIGRGSGFAYTLFSDQGKDQLASGRRISNDGDLRGVYMLEHMHQLNEEWSLWMEMNFLSDPTVIDALFDSWARTRREFANRLTLERIDQQTRFSANISGSFNDFTPNQYILQSAGATTTTMPEFRYDRVGDTLSWLYDNSWLTYTSSYRVGEIGLNMTEVPASELGYAGNVAAQRALGVNANQSPGDGLRSQGFKEAYVTRFDTRHEVSLDLGNQFASFIPFIAGRLTAYDDAFIGVDPNETERTRFWGGIGFRLATAFTRVNNSFTSSVLDIYRLRHIVEPSLQVMIAGTNIDQSSLPVYDHEVERLADGTIVNFGINQTIQTQRGGPGRWRTVDLLKVNADITLTSDDSDVNQSTVGRYFDFRPELGMLGDFGRFDAAWQLTDATSFVFDTTYSFDNSQAATTAAGFAVSHGDYFSMLAEMRFVNAEDATFLNLDSRYRLTEKYSMRTGLTYDTDRGDFQRISTELVRKFQSAELGFGFAVNNITDETGILFSIVPTGFDSRVLRVRGLGSNDRYQQDTRFGG